MSAGYNVQPLTDEDMAELGFNQDTSLCDAVGMVNNYPVKQHYETALDMNTYMVGWEAASSNPIVQRLFTKQTVQTIQQKVSEYLAGVDPNGKRIIPSERVVVNGLYGVFRSHTPEELGDIYGKYLVTNMNQRNDIAYMIDKTISLLVRAIRDELEMAQNNEKLTIWTTLLGDFNEHGLRQFPPIKVREKRPDNFLFHMRY